MQKSKFFCDKIQDCSLSKDTIKSWSLINTLLGRNSKSTNVGELLVNNTIISDDKLVAESFNKCFTNVGTKLAAESNVPNNNPCDDPMTDECVGHFPILHTF